MKELDKLKDNNIKELHLHKHQTIININVKTKVKRLVKPVRYYQIKCLVCGSQKKVTKVTKYCSQTCYNKYMRYKHKEFIHKQNKLIEETRIKKWWEF